MLIKINNLYFSYPTKEPLFQNLNLQFEEGKIIAIAGESGCGKSTLLALIYGLLDWQQGEIIFDNQKLLGPKENLVPGEKEMKFVAQNYDLMPYATVYDNVGKFISNIHLQEKKEKVQELLSVVGLEDFAKELPKNLSGGQQQRVAIARALSGQPKLLILDEPFSNLDFSRKIQLREKLFSYVKKTGVSLLISTHNLPEVLPWLDRIIVLQDGRLIQNESAEKTYKYPYNDYVARLFGEVNIFSEEEKQRFQLEKNYYYPTDIQVTSEGKAAQVLESRFSGNHFWNKLHSDGKTLIVNSTHQLSDEVKLSFC